MALCDYFSAPDDRAAAAVAGRSGGPAVCGLDAVPLTGVDPVVAVARLEAILTGCSYEEATRRPRAGRLLSPAQEDTPLVLSLSDTLLDALVQAEPSDLARAAGPWSRTAELAQARVDARTALTVLESLAALTRRAKADGRRVYCWWSL
jgi:hypothetical protein